jgi:hypothetical protein
VFCGRLVSVVGSMLYSEGNSIVFETAEHNGVHQNKITAFIVERNLAVNINFRRTLK